ncbi:MAG: tetratricopeptide repeat protein [Cyanothece sp. SIO2G6]|nr:tetratricopeptide repeat protein [Cyanothece sp. SIO2G6]
MPSSIIWVEPVPHFYSLISMSIEDIFLARTEEQQQFRRMLSAMLPGGWRKHLPTVARFIPGEPRADHVSIFLAYGEGGMGKTSLLKRLGQIVTQEKVFKGQVNVLQLDWENEQKTTRELQVGHDSIEPETVLNTLHRAVIKADWGSAIPDYEKAVQELRKLEAKVENALQKQPDNTLTDQVSKLGAKGLAYVIRTNPVTSPIANTIPQQSLENALDTTFQVGAEGLSQARLFVQRSLDQSEYALYEQPNLRLAIALGEGLARLSQQKPVVLLLDTYEIVDRPECDYILRRVIEASGPRVLWVIGGRANLADSGTRGKVYFRGYKRDFSETSLYTKSLSEFSLDLIQQYFAQVVPDAPLSDADADAVAQFSLGIPFVIRQAAVMYRDGKPLTEIVAPVTTEFGTSAHDQVVKETSERFLMHCFSAPEREQDLEAIYALALMRRPNPDLLRAMLDVTNLETRLQTLRQRYSFILVEQLRLDEKLNRFLRDYLLSPVRRTGSTLQRLNENAIAWLSLQLEEKTEGIVDTAEHFRESDIAELLLDIVHHQFWLGEDQGWRYLVPRFIEGWQYDRTWAKSLLEVVATFVSMLSNDNRQWLQQYTVVLAAVTNIGETVRVLEHLEKLQQRSWLEGKHQKEYQTILALQRGQLLFQQSRYQEALVTCEKAKTLLPDDCFQLRKNLANSCYQLSTEFIWPNHRYAIYSTEGQRSIQLAVELDPTQPIYHYYLGVAFAEAQEFEKAITAYEKAIELDLSDTPLYNGLGNVYRALKRYDEAIAAYEKAIKLDVFVAEPHNGLGNVYYELKHYAEAIAAYKKAIKRDKLDAYPHNNLGNVYCDLKRYDEAIRSYKEAIELDATHAEPHNGLGTVYRNLQRYEAALACHAKYRELIPTSAYPYTEIGLTHALQNQIGEAHVAWQKALDLFEADRKLDNLHKALYTLALGEAEQGLQQLQQLLQNGVDTRNIELVLKDVEVLAQCPNPPDRLDEFTTLLKTELETET